MQNVLVIPPHIHALTNVKLSGTLWPSIYADNPEQKRVLRALSLTRAGLRHFVHVPAVVYIRKSRSLGSTNVKTRFLFIMREKP